MQACAENSDSTLSSTSIQSGIPPRCQIRGGAKPLVIFAFAIVGAEILGLSFIGSKTWGAMYFAPPDPGSMYIDVQAGQFASYFRYPGAITRWKFATWWNGKMGIFGTGGLRFLARSRRPGINACYLPARFALGLRAVFRTTPGLPSS